ncbi:MAG: hypothetical protein LAQ69_00720 [Acidobacteriia bacterium]|nr:hypothetical protein [Terriglobia bacterium]
MHESRFRDFYRSRCSFDSRYGTTGLRGDSLHVSECCGTLNPFADQLPDSARGQSVPAREVAAGPTPDEVERNDPPLNILLLLLLRK